MCPGWSAHGPGVGLAFPAAGVRLSIWQLVDSAPALPPPIPRHYGDFLILRLWNMTSVTTGTSEDQKRKKLRSQLWSVVNRGGVCRASELQERKGSKRPV